MNHMLAAQADVRIPYIISIYIKLTFVHFKVSKQSKEYIILNTLTHAHTHMRAHAILYWLCAQSAYQQYDCANSTY